MAAGVHVADRKALLTRAGGRCPRGRDAARVRSVLAARFRCVACGRDYDGRDARRFWLYWLPALARRARGARGGAARARSGAPSTRRFAARVLAEAADVYLGYPTATTCSARRGRSSARTSSRIWLLQLCVALDLLESAGTPLGGASPARSATGWSRRAARSIASYDEGRSNRQVWNEAALLAAARAARRRARRRRVGARARRASRRTCATGCSPTARWYEGENYHLFAHRGLWYGVTMAARAGRPLDRALVERFDRGFAAPFLVAMPDPTLPARRDSQFAVVAAPVALGGVVRAGPRPRDARRRRRRLAGRLGALYDAGTGTRRPDRALARLGRGGAQRARRRAHPRRPRAGSRCCVRDARPRRSPRAMPVRGPARCCCREQGLAVLRGRGRGAYVSLDYGQPGGGHGHPDRLNVQLAAAACSIPAPGRTSTARCTGTAARSPTRRRSSTGGRSRGSPAGCSRSTSPPAAFRPWPPRRRSPPASSPGGGSCSPTATSSTISTGRGSAARTLDLPSAARSAWRRAPRRTPDGAGGRGRVATAERRGAGGLEDGFDFLADVEERALDAAGARLRVGARGVGNAAPAEAAVSVAGPPGALLWRAGAPGAPGHPAGPMCALRARGDTGALTVVWDLGGDPRVSRAADDGTLSLSLADGSRHRHHLPAPDGSGSWRGAARPRGRARRRRPLRARAVAAAAPDAPTVGAGRRAATGPVADLPADGTAKAFALGGPHYHRSEDAWTDAGRPTAVVTLAVRDDRLHVTVAAQLGRPAAFVDPAAENPLDNERAAVNGDGVQLHWAWSRAATSSRSAPGCSCPSCLAPRSRSRAPRPTTRRATRSRRPPRGPRRRAGGRSPRRSRSRRCAADGRGRNEATRTVALAVLVNESPAGRERRRGQLVLDGDWPAGAGVSFIYLRGDRYDPARGLLLRLPPAPDSARCSSTRSASSSTNRRSPSTSPPPCGR